MQLSEIFDSYDLKARWIPTVIVLLPAAVAVYAKFPALTASPVLAMGSGAISIALLYFASMIVRELGTRAQTELWRQWGGAPSTRFARMRDSRFSDVQKTLIRQKVQQQFHLDMFGADVERGNPRATDQAIDQAFKRVREFLRGRHKFGLVEKHNAEYGFTRNLYGSRWVLVSLAAAGAIVTGFGNGHLWPLSTAAAAEFLIAVVWVPVGFFLLPTMIKRNADNYAEKAWLSFLEVSKEEME
jgi:hypothetical protein